MQKLDARDIQILRVLASRGRITKAELAERVGLSPTPCWERLRKLEKAGVIEGYGARVSAGALGPSVTVFVAAELSGHRAEDFQTFERGVKAHDEITWCWALGGGFDYLFQVVARDIDAFQRLMDSLLESRIGLARYYSYIVTKPVKAAEGPPVHLFARED